MKKKKKNIGVYLVAGSIVGLVVLVSVLVAGANADRPCVVTNSSENRVVSIDGACVGGAWDGWETTNTTTDDSGAAIKEQRRTYTGTRQLSVVFDTTTTVNSCSGTTVSTQQQSESIACQLVNTRTIRLTGGDDDTSDDDDDINTEVIETDVVATDIGSSTVDTETISGNDSLLNARRNLINITITASPELIRSGDVSRITWDSVEADPSSCATVGRDIDGNIIDTWSGAQGSRTTSVLVSDTEYTVTCNDAIDFNPMAGNVWVRVAPVPSEQ